jgi:hypothetical protein
MYAILPRSYGISRMMLSNKTKLRTPFFSFPSSPKKDKRWTISERPWARDMDEEKNDK